VLRYNGGTCGPAAHPIVEAVVPGSEMKLLALLSLAPLRPADALATHDQGER
jgi:hypothetical protein